MCLFVPQGPRCSHGRVGYCQDCDAADNRKCVHGSTGYCEWCFREACRVNLRDDLIAGTTPPDRRGERYPS